MREKIEIMTFRPDGPLNGEIYDSLSPYVLNGRVFYRRVRITVEEVEEPEEVVADRLRMLLKSRNMHHRGAVRDQARKLGIDLDEGRTT